MDTIAAIATAQKPSAVGIVRISGSDTEKILSAVFTPASGMPSENMLPRRMVYGTICDANGGVLDHGLAVRFSKQHSYTGEDSAELHCHGSPVVLNEVLQACFAAGARQAKAGEFSKRAFLNGKMDLTEAEAVIDLIDAETAEAAHNAVLQMDGALRRLIDKSYDSLLEITSRFYAVVDYPDEDIEELTREKTEWALTETETALSRLLATYSRGRLLKSGAATAMIGAPNAGKSSLLNALVGYDRAIVTDIAGTTRDTVEEKCVVGGVLLRLIDTAGIRETDDTVERIGVERSRLAVEQADLVLALIDGSEPFSPEDLDTLDLASECGKPWILVQTKGDLPQRKQELLLSGALAPRTVVSLSAKTGEGIELLEKSVAEVFPSGEAPDGTLLTNARQADAAQRALACVKAAKDALISGMTPDVVLTEAEEAMAALGEMTGRTAREDMVARIFERFCVGK